MSASEEKCDTEKIVPEPTKLTFGSAARTWVQGFGESARQGRMGDESGAPAENSHGPAVRLQPPAIRRQADPTGSKCRR